MATGSGSFGQKLRENAFSLKIYNKRLKFQPPTVYFHNYVSPLIVPKFKMAATKPEVGIFSHPNVNTDEIPTPTTMKSIPTAEKYCLKIEMAAIKPEIVISHDLKQPLTIF